MAYLTGVSERETRGVGSRSPKDVEAARLALQQICHTSLTVAPRIGAAPDGNAPSDLASAMFAAIRAEEKRQRRGERVTWAASDDESSSCSEYDETDSSQSESDDDPESTVYSSSSRSGSESDTYSDRSYDSSEGEGDARGGSSRPRQREDFRWVPQGGGGGGRGGGRDGGHGGGEPRRDSHRSRELQSRRAR